MAGRRAEDKKALHTLGAAAIHLPLPEAIYRAGPDGAPLYPSREAIFGPLHPAEAGLVEELARALATLDLPSPARIYVPLGIGGHVDHVLTRRAAERWRPAHNAVRYYEDYPYAESPDRITAALGADTWHVQLIPLAPAHVEAKIAAIGCYTSQISSLFTDLADMRERVRTYTARLAQGQGYAERFYRAGERPWHAPCTL